MYEYNTEAAQDFVRQYKQYLTELTGVHYALRAAVTPTKL